MSLFSSKPKSQISLNNSTRTPQKTRDSIAQNPKEFYADLAQTERRIYSGMFSANDVTQLIQMYTRCIEHFDALFDPIASYFNDKIAQTLSSSHVIDMLSEEQPKPKQSPQLQQQLKQKEDVFIPPLQLPKSSIDKQHISQIALAVGQSQKSLLKNDEKQKIEHARRRNQVIEAQELNIAARLQQRKERVRSASRNNDMFYSTNMKNSNNNGGATTHQLESSTSAAQIGSNNKSIYSKTSLSNNPHSTTHRNNNSPQPESEFFDQPRPFTHR